MRTTPATLEIQPGRRLRGKVRVPGDKSISHRYALFGAIADGTTDVRGLSPGADVIATLACLSALGVEITRSADIVRIHGRGWGGLARPHDRLDAANSGTTLRLMAGILAGRPFTSVLTGDASLRRRPMQRIIEPLSAMGARVEPSSADGLAPLTITGGRLQGIHWRPPVASAQVKSAVLLAGLQASGTTTVDELSAARDHTERAFPAFGLSIDTDGRRHSIAGGQLARAPAQPLDVPGDPSSAAVWAAGAAALSGSGIEVPGVCLNPRRLGFVRVLRDLGADVALDQTQEVAREPVGVLRVSHGGHGHAVVGAADVPDVIDELPVLAACAALGGSLEVSGAQELRLKESDRITALVTGLRALGVDAVEQADGFVVTGGRPPSGGTADAAGDHRLVMAFALVALGATGPSRIAGADAVAVSYPDFERHLSELVS